MPSDFFEILFHFAVPYTHRTVSNLLVHEPLPDDLDLLPWLPVGFHLEELPVGGMGPFSRLLGTGVPSDLRLFGAMADMQEDEEGLCEAVVNLDLVGMMSAKVVLSSSELSLSMCSAINARSLPLV